MIYLEFITTFIALEILVGLVLYVLSLRPAQAALPSLLDDLYFEELKPTRIKLTRAKNENRTSGRSPKSEEPKDNIHELQNRTPLLKNRSKSKTVARSSGHPTKSV